ncbi:hypothetical protein OROGR_028192 [Orobanche gracilis]
MAADSSKFYHKLGHKGTLEIQLTMDFEDYQGVILMKNEQPLRNDESIYSPAQSNSPKDEDGPNVAAFLSTTGSGITATTTFAT